MVLKGSKHVYNRYIILSRADKMRLRSKAMKIVEKTCYFQMLVASTIINIISKKEK